MLSLSHVGRGRQRKINALIGNFGACACAHMFRVMGFAAIFDCTRLQSEHGVDKTLGHLFFFPGLLDVFGLDALPWERDVVAAEMRNCLAPAGPACSLSSERIRSQIDGKVGLSDPRGQSRRLYSPSAPLCLFTPSLHSSFPVTQLVSLSEHGERGRRGHGVAP